MIRQKQMNPRGHGLSWLSSQSTKYIEVVGHARPNLNVLHYYNLHIDYMYLGKKLKLFYVLSPRGYGII